MLTTIGIMVEGGQAQGFSPLFFTVHDEFAILDGAEGKMNKGKTARPGGGGRGDSRPKPTRPSIKLIGIIVAIVVVIVAAGVLVIPNQTPKAPERVQGLPQDFETKGSAAAKVTITEYSDYQ